MMKINNPPWELMAKAKGTNKTASGSIVNINDALAASIRSLLVNIDPVQVGSGDPSPYNVRPISGWSEVNVWRTRKNLVDISQFATKYPYYCSFSDGVLSVNSDSILYNVGISVDIPAGAIVNYAVEYGTASNVRVRLVYDDDTILDISSPPYPTQKYVKALQLNWTNRGTFLLKNFQIELGSTATAYEPYQGDTYTIQLGQTVYGATLDVTNGVLTVDRAMVDLGTLSWNYNSTYIRFISVSALPNAKIPPNNWTVAEKLICSNYKTTTSNGTASEANNKSVGLSADGKLVLRDTTYTDPTTLQSAMSGVQLCYELATPITIPLTPQEISTLKGTNNLWAYSGDVGLVYKSNSPDESLMKLAIAFINRR